MSKSPKLLLGSRKGLITLAQNGKGWRVENEAHVGNPVAYADYDAEQNNLWATLDHGHWGQKLQRSRDHGKTWEEVPAPKYPEHLELKPGKPATLRYLWVLGFGGRQYPQRLLAGTEPGGLFQSDDNGASFHLVESLWNHPSRVDKWMGGGRDEAGIHSIVLDPRKKGRYLLGISCAGVFETTDDGKSWTPRNQGLVADFMPDPNIDVGHDVHFMTACPANPDVIWQQNHCGVFRSVDGAKSWQAVSQKGDLHHFGFSIAVDAKNPDVAWNIPAEGDSKRVSPGKASVVCRTENGGKSWTALRQGLPQENCYDISLRHAFAIHGRQLAFATTTGNVFYSGDGGEGWQCLGNHFPPVYSVRFGSF